MSKIIPSAALFAATILVAIPAPAPAETTSQGYQCAFTEGQAWWSTTPGKSGTDFGHLHIGACMPHHQQVSGVLVLDVRIIMHDNPGKFDYLNPVLKTDAQELSLTKNYSISGATCPVGTCVYDIPISVDTRLSKYDGKQEIRLRSYVKEPDGKIMHASINTIVDIRNGKSVNNLDRKAYSRGKGWYTGSGYCESSIRTQVPVIPVSSWTPTIQVVNHGSSEDLAVSRHSVILDADFHSGIPGTVITSGNGQLQPTAIAMPALAPGEHRLLIKADCDDPSGSTNSGLLTVKFSTP